MFSFCLLNNILYKLDYNEEGFYRYDQETNFNETKETLTKELAKYNPNNPSDTNMYLSIQTKLELCDFQKDFSKDTWQYQRIFDYLYEDLYQLNKAKHDQTSPEEFSSLNQKYQTKKDKFREGNWQYFIQLELEKLKDQVELQQINQKETIDKQQQEEIKNTITNLNQQIEILQYRLDQNINEDNTYLNIALNQYQESLEILNQNQKKKKTNTEIQEYQKAIQTKAINQYIIEHKVNLQKQNTLNYQLRTIVEDYEIFFIILILFVTSIIVCDEFHTGTIKLLLIKPYSRVKILLSKYITSFIVLLITIMLLVLAQCIIGGIFFGLESLSISVIEYRHDISSLQTFSIWSYMLIRILFKLPLFTILLTISFLIGILFTNTALSITMPFLLYMFANTIHLLAVQYHLKWMRYIITMNWDLSIYLFGKISDFPNIHLKFSIIIDLIYYIILLFISIKTFQKKNIKNI